MTGGTRPLFLGISRFSPLAGYTFSVTLPAFQALPLSRRPEPFSHPDWLFEVKYDGFRALTHLDPSGVRLVSRNGNRFASFTDLCASLEFFLKAKHAVLDGEIVSALGVTTQDTGPYTRLYEGRGWNLSSWSWLTR